MEACFGYVAVASELIQCLFGVASLLVRIRSARIAIVSEQVSMRCIKHRGLFISVSGRLELDIDRFRVVWDRFEVGVNRVDCCFKCGASMARVGSWLVSSRP